jgi:hypothetical protein
MDRRTRSLPNPQNLTISLGTPVEGGICTAPVMHRFRDPAPAVPVRILDVKGSDSHVPGTRFGGVPGNGRCGIRTHGLRLAESQGGHPPTVSAWEEATFAAWDLKAASGNSRAWMRKYRPRALRKSRRPTTLQTCAEIAGSRMPSPR